MPSPSAILRGLVSRMLPQPDADSPYNERAVRLGRYGDMMSQPVFPDDSALADEGSIFVASTAPGATALQLGISATFSATAAAFVLVNSDTAGGKRAYLRSLKLAQSVAPTSGVDLRYAVVLDSINRMPTTIAQPAGALQGPGTPATASAYQAPASCTNQDSNDRRPICLPFFPISIAAGAPPTVPAASPQARTIVGNGYVKNSIPVVKDQYTIQFGGVDAGGTFQAAAALAKIVEHAPKVVIGPGQSALIYLWSASNITAGNAWDDVRLEWAER